MNGEPEEDWKKTFANLKEFHDMSYVKLDEAIKLEEEGRKDVALQRYEEGLRLMDLALEIRLECPSNPDLNWEKACVMLQKLRKTRKEVLGRIADVQVTPQQQSDPLLAPPPSYEEAMSLTPTPTPTLTPILTPSVSTNSMSAMTMSSGPGTLTDPMTYSQLGEALSNLKVQTSMQSAQVIYSHENVKIYFISPDGVVTSSSEPSVLRILQLEDGTDAEAAFYLQVGDWFYPLVPDVSPCYRADFGAFILPDVHGEDGSAVGLILPPEADVSVYSFLEDILHCIVTSQPIPAPRSQRVRREDSSTSTTLSRTIVSGAQYISSGLVRGAEKASQLLNTGTPKLLEKITPEPTPRNVSPGVAKGVEVARNVSGSAVVVTGYVAGKVGSATMALGRYLAPHIQKHGTRLLSSAGGIDEKAASEKVGGMLTVAAGAVEGFSTVYTGLEQSAGILGNSLANNTVQIVQHKYGQPMGVVTDNTLQTIGNTFVATNNVKFLTPKGLAKKTAKDTGRAFVHEFRSELSNELDQSQIQNGQHNQLEKPGPSKQ